MCTTAHPIGCARHVESQVERVRAQNPYTGAQRVLIIGASTGYGLSSRLTAAFGSGASTFGVFYERPGDQARTATPGWYNSAATTTLAHAHDLYAENFNGDAFADESKRRVLEKIQRDWGRVDLLVYSLASPRRQHPITGKVHKSVIKPIGNAVTERSLDTDKCEVGEVTIDPASDEEIADTIAVMGGDDWHMWVQALDDAGLIATNFKTIAYTYIGDKVTWPIYGHATIGAAKKDLDETAVKLRERLAGRGNARIAVLKAVVTQASSAIPIMPLYLSLLFRVMKQQGTHQGCIEQIDGLFRDCVYNSSPPDMDNEGRWRMDGHELAPEVQRAIEKEWQQVTTHNVMEVTDFASYQREFLQLFGFAWDGVDYDADVDVQVTIPHLME